MLSYYRSTNCGAITTADVNKTVTLCGWVNKIRVNKNLIFIDIRDIYGVTQAVLLADSPFFTLGKKLKPESVIQVHGQVKLRKTANHNLKTGLVEVIIAQLQVLSVAKELPFTIKNAVNAQEDLRLQYRYLDLRRQEMQATLLLKHKIIQIFRQELNQQQFLDIETPCLVKPSCEGAREFLVPARRNKGSFYTLAQSPQMYKQLLMMSGIDKYYQVAKCFRDEDLRTDRQPEFLQLDLEMAFVKITDVLQVIEQLLTKLWEKININNGILPSLLRLSYDVAIKKYGSDKPDLRCLCEIVTYEKQLSAFFVNDQWDQKTAKAILRLFVQHQGKVLLVYDIKSQQFLYSSNQEILIPSHMITKIQAQAAACAKTLVYMIFEQEEVSKTSLLVLGAIRNFYCYDEQKKLKHRDFLANEHLLVPLWIVDFPLFEKVDEQIISCHNPFTSPVDLQLFLTTPKAAITNIKAASYDLVINGYEAGGGSIRISDKLAQTKVFEILGLTKAAIATEFGFFLDAFDYGIPPHGGFAIGIDRLVMVINKNKSVRDSIAFPKNNNGICLLSKAPNNLLSSEQLAELGLKLFANKAP